MLRLGSSKPWQDAIEELTGERRMNSTGLLTYFEPLMKWLVEENKKTNENVGWKPTTKSKSSKFTMQSQ